MRVQRPRPSNPAVRRGVTTPLIAAALLLAGLGIALVLDRVWLDAAQVELVTATEAAALAAAKSLACDDLLKPNRDDALITNRALEAAATIAERNRVAGSPVTLDLAGGDVQIGRMAASEETGAESFVQTDASPNQVCVTAHRSRARGNPVALFASNLTRQPYGDVTASAAASITNQISGLRPFDGAPVPAMPLAIWRSDPSGRCQETWQTAIEMRRGKDEFGYNESQQEVTTGSDGIPEITLRSLPKSGQAEKVNLQLLDFGTNFDTEALERQFARGLSSDDLTDFGGELRTGNLKLRSTAKLENTERDALAALLGEAKVCCIYSIATPVSPTQNRTTCDSFVAVRVLAVRSAADGAAEIVVQPAVITTRTALVEDSQPASANPYIYRLTLTR